MSNIQLNPATLILKDGTVFNGKAAGKIGTVTGEICFNTGMTGYQEVFTDPSYYGQMLVMTSDHIGNYGTKIDDIESAGTKIAGLVMKNFSDENYSRNLGDSSLQTYLEENNLVAICDIDTRALVRHIRDKGAMNAIISSEELDENKLKAQLEQVPSMAGLELATKVTCAEPFYYGDPDATYRIAVLDVGIKLNILHCFAERDCYLKVFPAKTAFEEMQEWDADGYFISNGPGDPSAMDYAITTVKSVINSGKPTFGICLGHQIIALASGISTYKMFNGHRGLNHPIKNLVTGTCEITSQNHGFVITREDVEQADNVEITHVHLNDDTVAGIKLKDKKVFSVQYHPESSPGPHDSRYLFDDFISLLN